MATMVGSLRAPGREIVTANDRLKNSFNPLLAGCLAAAALVHFLLLALWPPMQTADYAVLARELTAVELPPPQIEIPPPPAAIARPQVPILSTRVDISEEITIAEVTFRSNPVESLPPPPTGESVDLSEQPVFTPRTVEPRLPPDQRTLLQRYLERNYPSALQTAGIGARATLWVFIDEAGEVRNTRVVESSGYEAFDQVAQDALRTVRFAPAMNRDQRVPVWVQLPITWKVQ